ncbi:MAG: endopeptidase La [Eubacteriales bacterium]|nr:endopeptidase La [Eubacteriales bacterium]
MEPQNPDILNMPMLPLRGLVLFPRMILHFDVGRPRSVRAVEHAIRNNTPVFVVAQKDIRNADPSTDDLYAYGTIATVRQTIRLGSAMRVLVEGSDRARLSRVWQEDPYLRVEVEREHIAPVTASSTENEALVRHARELFEQYVSLNPNAPQELILNAFGEDELGYLADYMAQNCAADYGERQKILEIFDPVERLGHVCDLLAREIQVLEINHELSEHVQEQMNKNQRDYVLREQMKAIREELGEDAEDNEAEQYRQKIRKLKLREEDEARLLTEAGRLAKMQPMSPETGVIRTYLDTVLELPWNKRTRERIDVAAARRILDADHYGLEKVKERILETVAVRQLAPDLKGQILCLVGPPGVGKTSIGVSIARALNRKYARLSLGGVRDEADIRGHRKTYIGAMPGRIINALRQAGSKNALLLLDEVDKLGQDFHGDPASALLEVLDAEQNAAFRDHYIELPFDLSEVLFVVTANTTETIPRPLLDRMEVIELPSYTDEEKLQIAKKHLLPKQMKKHGLRRPQLRISDDALRAVITGYTRESGVRNLERELAQICRRTAKALVENPELKRVTLQPDGLEPYLGVRKIYPPPVSGQEVGVVNGLAWTEAGGELLEVEVSVVEGTGAIELTGNLGDVMKESAHAARTYIRSRAKSLGIDPEFYKNRDIHIHFPEAAVPKDGPSAGVTVCTAMISALTGIPVVRRLAMTGEVTLRGRVLPIGGLREKTMAALRNGITTVIIPAQNAPDLEEIDPAVRGALHFVTAETMDTVLETALARLPAPVQAQNTAAAPDAKAPLSDKPVVLPSAQPSSLPQ